MDDDSNSVSNHHYSTSPTVGSDVLVGEIIAIIDSVNMIGEFRKTQRKECLNLVRRLKFFSPILDRIRDVESRHEIEIIECLKRFHRAFRSAFKLLKMCHAGSKIYLVLESEAMKVRFHSVYDKISQAIKGMPYDELGISDQDKELMKSLRVQLKRAKTRTDTQDMELTMDVMVVLSKNNDRDSASIERLANKLALRTPEDLEVETIAIQKLVKERRGHNAESTQQIRYLLKKFKQVAGIVEDDTQDEAAEEPKPIPKLPTAAVPNEFLCPITLEIMTDPVIVATGQTYERESIQQWLDSDHRTCPKTGQDLTHLSLAPNFALKNVILHWCDENNFTLPIKKKVESAETPPPAEITTPNGKILSLVQSLSSSKLDEQREAVRKIRFLSKESSQNRIRIANAQGIPPLVNLLSYPDSKIQEHAVTALLNLSIDDSNKKLISGKDPIPAIIEILDKGSIGAKENSAAALFSLSMLDENKSKIGYLNGIPVLVELLRTGTIRGKKDAITALFNLCLTQSNKSKAIEAGIIAPLLKVLQDEKLDMVNESLSLLLVLASCTGGRHELSELPFIESLVSLIREGSPKNKECATAVLLELGSGNSNLILAALQYGVYEHLAEVSKNGTERAQRKANSVLKLMSEFEQLP